MQPNREPTESIFNKQSQKLLDFLKSEGAATVTDIHQHQIDAVLAVREYLSDPTNPNIALVVLPTGCGKTGVAILASYVLNATKVLVITPSVTISEQIYDAFCNKDKMFLFERKIITAEDKKWLLPLGVCIKNSAAIISQLHFHLMIVNAHKIGGQAKVAIEDIPSDNYDLVIVDEAHHYPAATWRLLVDHFSNSSRLFLTATPSYRGRDILSHPPCFELTRDIAVSKNVIRPISFKEAEGINPDEAIAKLIEYYLDEHDELDPRHKHQAMVLTLTINGATKFVKTYSRVSKKKNDRCEKYTSESKANVPANDKPSVPSEDKLSVPPNDKPSVPSEDKPSVPPNDKPLVPAEDIFKDFVNGDIRVLVVAGKLLEGFDRKHVSVVGIVRKVARESKVLFAQFVGRAVRKFDNIDPVTTIVVSHEFYNQRENFDQFDKVTDYDNIDEL